nr:transmembrane protein 214-like [Tanacetum cinerariifolium]
MVLPSFAMLVINYFAKSRSRRMYPGLKYGRYGVSKVLDTAHQGFLGVGTTSDIFQNILFRYSLNTTYCLLLDTAYWILFPLWSLGRLRCKGVTKRIIGVIPKGLALLVFLEVTERLKAMYLTLKEVALAGSPGSKAMKKVSQQIYTVTLKASGEVIIEYLVKLTKRHVFGCLNKDILKITVLTTNTSSIKEDTAYLCLHSSKTTKETRSNTLYPEEGNTSYSSYKEINYSGRYQT